MPYDGPQTAPATAVLYLADGAHTFTVKAVDAAGNTSAASAALNVTVDSVAPTAPVIAALLATTAAWSATASPTTTTLSSDRHGGSRQHGPGL